MKRHFLQVLLLSLALGIAVPEETLSAAAEIRRELPQLPSLQQQKLLGKGDQAKVYKAIDAKQQQFAIKVFYTPSEMQEVHPERKMNIKDYFESDGGSKAAIDEYKVALQIPHHSGLMKIYSKIESQNDRGERVTSLVMEYIEGKNLNKVSNGTLSPQEVRECAKSLLSALSYAFSKGLIHDDLWSENVYIDKNNSLKLIDLGSFDPLPSARLGEKPKGHFKSYYKVIQKVLKELMSASSMKDKEAKKLIKSLDALAKKHGEIPLSQESSHQVAQALDEMANII